MSLTNYIKIGVLATLTFAYLAIVTACVSPPLVGRTEVIASPTALAPIQKPIERPTQKVETIKVNNIFPKNEVERSGSNIEDFPNYSVVSIENITSGKLAKVGEAWIEENPFPSEAIPAKHAEINQHKMKLIRASTNVEYNIVSRYINILSSKEYQNNPNTRPFKIISFYRLVFDSNLFDKIGWDSTNPRAEIWAKQNFWIIQWAYLNPSGKTTICQSFVDIFQYNVMYASLKEKLPQLYREGRDVKFLPVIGYSQRNDAGDKIMAESEPEFILDTIYNNYPELKPEPYLGEFSKTMEIPKETQNKLFGVEYQVTSYW